MTSSSCSGAEAPPPQRARRAVAVLFFFNGALFASWASRIPAVQEARGLSHAQLGLALLAIGLGAILAMPLAGLWIARQGSRRVCQVTARLYALSLVAIVLLPGPLGLLLALLGFGAFHGALDIAMNAQAVAVERRYPRPIMASFHALWSFGGLAGALAGAGLAALGLTPAVHLLAVTAALGLGLWRFLPDLLDAPPEPEAASGAGRRVLRGDLLVLGLIAFCIMLGEGAMADWSAVYLRHHLGSSESLAALGYAVFSVSMALGRVGGDWLAQRFGALALVRLGGALAAVGLGAGLLSGQVWLVLPGLAATGLGFANIVPQVFSSAGHRPGVNAGAALATVSTLGYLGFLLGPPAIGWTAEWLGLPQALGLVVLTSLLAAGCAGVLRPRTAAVSQTDPEPEEARG